MNALSLLVPFLTAGGATSVPMNEPTLSVVGDVSRRATYTNESLRRVFEGAIREVTFKLKEETGRARAVPLSAIIEASFEKPDPKRKNSVLGYSIACKAADGYTVTFSAGELKADVGGLEVWVALDWNGKPLSGEDGPVRLIVPRDEKPSRWVHGLRTLRIVNLAK